MVVISVSDRDKLGRLGHRVVLMRDGVEIPGTYSYYWTAKQARNAAIRAMAAIVVGGDECEIRID